MQKTQSTPQLQQQWSKMRTQQHCIEIYPPFQYRYDDFNPGTRDITGSYLHTALVKDEKKSDSLVAQVKKKPSRICQSFLKPLLFVYLTRGAQKYSSVLQWCKFQVKFDKAYLCDNACFINACAYVN